MALTKCSPNPSSLHSRPVSPPPQLVRQQALPKTPVRQSQDLTESEIQMGNTIGELFGEVMESPIPRRPVAIPVPVASVASVASGAPSRPFGPSSSIAGKQIRIPVRHRHRHQRRHMEAKISKAAIRKLARRGGVKRIDALVYDETRDVLKSFLRKVISKTIPYTEYAGRKTVTPADVVHGLRVCGTTLYMFGSIIPEC